MKFKSFDEFHLMKHFNGDEEILVDMIDAFQEGLVALLNPIRESIHNKNADQLRINAHTFKGVMRNFYAADGVSMAYELEMCGQKSNFDESFLLLNHLEDQLVLFLYEIDKLKIDLNKLL